jgi:hypothetical protein
LTIVLGEILKITLVERLFRLTRDRLMQIPIFALLYNHWIRLHNWITSSVIWQWMRGQTERLKLLFRRAMASIKAIGSEHFLPARNGRVAERVADDSVLKTSVRRQRSLKCR